MAATELRSYENVLVVVLGLGGAVAALDGQALFYLSPFVAKELHLNNLQVGLVSSIVVCTWAISACVVGFRSDRSGKRKSYLAGAFLMFAVCSALSGFAATFAMLFAARALVGVAEGPVIPLSQAIMMAESSAHRRGVNMGIVQNFGAQLCGSMLGPLIMVWLATAADWHTAFFLAGVPGLLVAFLVAAFVHDPEARPADAGGATMSVRGGGIRALLIYNNVRICLIVSCFVVGAYFLILTFLPLYCVQVLKMSSRMMSVVMGCAGAAGVLSSILVPLVSDRLGRKPTLTAFSLVGMVTPVGALVLGDSHWLLLAVFVGAMLPGTTPLFMGTVPMETVPPRDAAAASGLIMAFGSIVGGFAGPALGGVLADRFGLAVPLMISAAMALCAALASMWLDETAPARNESYIRCGGSHADI